MPTETPTPEEQVAPEQQPAPVLPEQQSAPDPGPLPEVRQCQDAENFLYGASAVAAGDDRWGVMSPTNGGHWATDAEVAEWTVLS